MSTTKNLITKSAAEEKMTSEAIKDVYWHGLNSQKPAHFLDLSVRHWIFEILQESVTL